MINFTGIGKILVFISSGTILFGVVLLINDDGGSFTGLAIPFVFLGMLVLMASILFMGNFNKKAFHTNNLIFLFMLISFNILALFGAEFSGGAGPETYFGTGLSYVIWGSFYLLQFVRTSKIWRICWFLMMGICLFYWQTGLGVKVGLMFFS